MHFGFSVQKHRLFHLCDSFFSTKRLNNLQGKIKRSSRASTCNHVSILNDDLLLIIIACAKVKEKLIVIMTVRDRSAFLAREGWKTFRGDTKVLPNEREGDKE